MMHLGQRAFPYSLLILTTLSVCLHPLPALGSNLSEYSFLKKQALEMEPQIKAEFERLQKAHETLKKSLAEVDQVRLSLRSALRRMDKARSDVEMRQVKRYYARQNAEKLRADVAALEAEVKDLSSQIQGDADDALRQKRVEANANLKIQQGNLERAEKEVKSDEELPAVQSEAELELRRAHSDLPVLERRVASDRKSLEPVQKDYDRVTGEYQEILDKLSLLAPEDPPWARSVRVSMEGKEIYKAEWREQTEQEKRDMEKYRRMQAALQKIRALALKVREAIPLLMERKSMADESVLRKQEEAQKAQDTKAWIEFAWDYSALLIMAEIWLHQEAASLVWGIAGDLMETQAGGLAGQGIDQLCREREWPERPETLFPRETDGWGAMQHIFDGSSWEEVMDSAFRAQGLPGVKAIEKMAAREAWNESFEAAHKAVEGMKIEADSCLHEMISKATEAVNVSEENIGKDTAVTFIRMKTERTRTGQMILREIGKGTRSSEPRIKVKGKMRTPSVGPAGPRDLLETLFISTGREMLVYFFDYWTDDLVGTTKKNLLEAEIFRAELSHFLGYLEQSLEVMSAKIKEGQELLKWLEDKWERSRRGGDERRLAPLTDERAEENKEYDVNIYFSLPVQVLSVTLGGRSVQGRSDPQYPKFWKGKVRVDRFEKKELKSKRLTLALEAQDEDRRLLDSDPATVAYRAPAESRWNAYESQKGGADTHQGGPDQNHFLRLRRESALRRVIFRAKHKTYYDAEWEKPFFAKEKILKTRVDQVVDLKKHKEGEMDLIFSESVEQVTAELGGKPFPVKPDWAKKHYHGKAALVDAPSGGVLPLAVEWRSGEKGPDGPLNDRDTEHRIQVKNAGAQPFKAFLVNSLFSPQDAQEVFPFLDSFTAQGVDRSGRYIGMSWDKAQGLKAVDAQTGQDISANFEELISLGDPYKRIASYELAGGDVHAQINFFYFPPEVLPDIKQSMEEIKELYPPMNDPHKNFQESYGKADRNRFEFVGFNDHYQLEVTVEIYRLPGNEENEAHVLMSASDMGWKIVEKVDRKVSSLIFVDV